MYTKTQITQTKESVSILDYLSAKGIEPIEQIGRQYVYLSPITGETGTPSFFVDPQKNVFSDFSGGADPSFNDNQGDLLRLIQVLEKCSFMKAMEIALNLSGAGYQGATRPEPAPEKEHTTFIKRVTSIYAYPLKNYLTERAIPFDVARRYLSEVHYYNANGDFYALGFRNDAKGYELRSTHFKGCLGQKTITTLGNPAAAKAIVFEGFFDFLSWMPTEERLKRNFVVVLNSLSLVNRLPDLTRFEAISLYFDNDASGIKAAENLGKKYWAKCENASQMYFPQYKDYNDFLISKRIGK